MCVVVPRPACGQFFFVWSIFLSGSKIKQKSYRDYLSIEEAGKELFLNAVGDNTVVPLKKQYIGFGNITVLQMIDLFYASRRRSG